MLTAARYGTRDLARAGAFYDAIAAELGGGRIFERDTMIAYKGADGGMFIIGTPFDGEASVGNGVQISFGAPSREAIHAVHAKALELGGTCDGAPGPRGPEGGFYGAYFRDLDGNKICVFRMG